MRKREASGKIRKRKGEEKERKKRVFRVRENGERKGERKERERGENLREVRKEGRWWLKNQRRTKEGKRQRGEKRK